jgi:hypothetical protein
LLLVSSSLLAFVHICPPRIRHQHRPGTHRESGLGSGIRLSFLLEPFYQCR